MVNSRQERFIEVLYENNGNVLATCRQTKTERHEYRRWVKDHDFNEKAEEMRALKCFSHHFITEFKAVECYVQMIAELDAD